MNKNKILLFEDYAYQYLLHQLQRESNEKMEIYSNDQKDLPPKLRLPKPDGKPAPIIIFAKQNFYFSYDTEPNPVQCQRNDQNCQQSSTQNFQELVEYDFVFLSCSFSRS